MNKALWKMVLCDSGDHFAVCHRKNARKTVAIKVRIHSISGEKIRAKCSRGDDSRLWRRWKSRQRKNTRKNMSRHLPRNLTKNHFSSKIEL